MTTSPVSLRRSGATLIVLAFTAVLGGADCEGPPDGGEGEGEGEPIECFFGDEGQEPAGELVFLNEDFQMEDLAPGQLVPTILPPQGGKVILVGARLKNMDMCSLQANGGAFDDCQQPARIIGREGRGMRMVENAAIGFAEPQDPTTLNNYVNIPLCQNFSSSRDIDGEPYRVELRFSDRARRSLVLTADITPYCPGTPGDPDGNFEACECECDADYSFERQCEEILVDTDRAAGICPALVEGDPLPACTPACDAGRVCLGSGDDPAVGICL